MLLIMNIKGMVNAIVSLGASFGLRVAGVLDPQPALILMGIFLILIDLGIRRPQEGMDLVDLKKGGYFFFIPMWIRGISAAVGYAFIWT